MNTEVTISPARRPSLGSHSAKWLVGVILAFAAMVLSLVLVRELNPLPSLENRTVSRAFTDTAETPLGQAIAPAAEAHPGLTGIHPLPSGSQGFAARAMLARAATRSIDAQYYSWYDDLTGSLLYNELLAAADRGVRVRLLLDDIETADLDPLIASLDSQPNVEVRLFNPFTLRDARLFNAMIDMERINHRMHNKAFIVDNQAAVVGGRNIGDEYLGRGWGALYVDLDVLAVGQAVNQTSREFDTYWASESAYPAASIVKPVSGAELREVRERLSSVTRTPQGRAYLAAARYPLIPQLVQQQLRFEWVPVRVIADDPAKALGEATREDLLFTQLIANTGGPQRSLGMVSAYFVPGVEGTRALSELAERGVDVTVMTNSLESTDVWYVHSGYAPRRKTLLQAGVQLFELRGPDAQSGREQDVAGFLRDDERPEEAGSAVHAKTYTVDDRHVFIGSFNFDPRSARFNTELGFVIESPALARAMAESFRSFAPANTYRVQLSRDGDLYWTERRGNRTIRHDTEPGTSWWERTKVFLLSLLPIDWLL